MNFFGIRQKKDYVRTTDEYKKQELNMPMALSRYSMTISETFEDLKSKKCTKLFFLKK